MPCHDIDDTPFPKSTSFFPFSIYHCEGGIHFFFHLLVYDLAHMRKLLRFEVFPTIKNCRGDAAKSK